MSGGWRTYNSVLRKEFAASTVVSWMDSIINEILQNPFASLH